MPRKTSSKSTKKSTKKAASKKTPEVEEDEDELAGIDEELAALESATDLEDLDDGDDDEPGDEDDDDEEETPAKRKKSSRKKAAATDADAEDDEEDEDEEGDDEDEEEDELDELDRAALKEYITDNEIDLGEKVKKSWSDDDIRERIRAAASDEDDEEGDEDDDDEEETPPAKKGRGRPKGSGSKPAREKKTTEDAILTADDLAHIGGVPEHQVRGFARKYPKAFPKASAKAQYRFNVKQARALLKGLGAVE